MLQAHFLGALLPSAPLQADVLISGNAYKYVVEDLQTSPYKDDAELAVVQKRFRPMVEELHTRYGVRFDMCNSGMEMRNIGAESVYRFVNTDKSNHIYLIDR